MSESIPAKPALLPLDPNDLTKGKLVQVNYKGMKLLEKVASVAANGYVIVRCLEKQLGVREGQQLERKGDTCFYNYVYSSSVTPNIVKVGRKWLWTY